MEVTKITFQADEQNLVKTSGVDVFASDTVSYIEADFSLGTNWQGYDSVRAMWKFGTDVYSTVLDHDGKCIVPWEVLTKRGELKVNLVGSISENGELTDRLTTFPIIALIISKIAQVEGDNSTPPTPSEYEQFVEDVQEYAQDAYNSKVGAEQARDSALESAGIASNMADTATQAKNYAVQQAQLAADAKEAAQTAQGLAERAKDSAVSAKEDAERARDSAIEAKNDAQGYAQDAERASQSILGLQATAEVDANVGTPSVSVSVSEVGGNKVMDFAFHNLKGVQGETGADGEDGADGFSPTVEVTPTTDGNEVTITDKNGEHTFEVLNGNIEDFYPFLPTDTASGSIASFPDGADDIPMSSVKASISPIQDLHGQTSPYPAGGGVNLLFVNSRVDTTIADVIYTSDDDYITLNGTKNGQGYADLSALTITLDAGTYYFRAFNISGSVAGSDYALYAFDGTSNLTGSIFTEKSLTLEETKTIRFRFGIFTNGIVFTNFKVGIVVSKTSGISTFAPYSNICPISGTTEVNVFVEDTYDASADPTATVNLGQTVYGGTVDVVSGVLTVDRAMTDLGGLNWTKRATRNGHWRFTTQDIPIAQNPTSETLPNMICTIYMAITPLQSYQGVTGVSSNQTLSQLLVCDESYTDATTFTSAMNGVKLVYPLATPTVIQLTPQEVTSLLGGNTVWADSGDVEVTYKADIQRYIDKKISAVLNA